MGNSSNPLTMPTKNPRSRRTLTLLIFVFLTSTCSYFYFQSKNGQLNVKGYFKLPRSTFFLNKKYRAKLPQNDLELLLDQNATHNGLSAFVNVADNSEYRDHCKTCAVVSSSGILLGSKAGVEIDSHHCVFRMNHHGVENYETDVGQKTTHRVVAHSSDNSAKLLLPFESLHNTTYLIWGPKQSVEKGHRGYARRFAQNTYQKYNKTMDVFIVKNDTSTMYFDNIWVLERGLNRSETHTWLSTGFFTVVTALNICEEVRLFGFVQDDHCRKGNSSKDYKYQYDQKNSQPTACSELRSHQNSKGYSHSFFTEHEIFHRWTKYRIMQFRVPQWG